MSNFRSIDRQTPYLLPPSVEDWLPERHLARFVVDVTDGLDVSAMSGAYRGSGSASYHPRLLVALPVYGYATGVSPGDGQVGSLMWTGTSSAQNRRDGLRFASDLIDAEWAVRCFGRRPSGRRPRFRI